MMSGLLDGSFIQETVKYSSQMYCKSLSLVKMKRCWWCSSLRECLSVWRGTVSLTRSACVQVRRTRSSCALRCVLSARVKLDFSPLAGSLTGSTYLQVSPPFMLLGSGFYPCCHGDLARDVRKLNFGSVLVFKNPNRNQKVKPEISVSVAFLKTELTCLIQIVNIWAILTKL